MVRSKEELNGKAGCDKDREDAHLCGVEQEQVICDMIGHERRPFQR
jgi:hypothetical protein